MYKPIQNHQIAKLIKERLTSPVACELTHVFGGSFEPRMKIAGLSNYLISRLFQLTPYKLLNQLYNSLIACNNFMKLSSLEKTIEHMKNVVGKATVSVSNSFQRFDKMHCEQNSSTI